MAKVYITTKEGTKIIIEGTPKEVAFVAARLREGVLSLVSSERKTVSKQKGKDKAKATPVNLIANLIDGGFFGKPKELSAIKLALEEQGYHYPITSLSSAVLRLVRRGQLQRKKEKKHWLYAH